MGTIKLFVLPFVLRFLVLIFATGKCSNTSAYNIRRLPNQRLQTTDSKLILVPDIYPNHHRIGMSVAVSTIANDDDRTMILVGSKGNNLQVTWELDVANDILRRANDAKQTSSGGSGGRDGTIPSPYMVGIAGIPGSGKSSSAEIITHLINEISSKRNQSSTPSNDDGTMPPPPPYHENATGICVCIPADGYHYSVQTLQELQLQKNDPTLIYRRGAPDTFDVSALIRDLERIRYPHHKSKSESGTDTDTDTDSSIDGPVKLPGFDHAIGDPTIHQHIYDRNQHSILIMEGLYLLYDQYQWDHIKDYFDHTIYIQTHSIDTCMERVKERNACIPGYTLAEIHERVDLVDRNNAILIDEASPSRAHQVITSTTATS